MSIEGYRTFLIGTRQAVNRAQRLLRSGASDEEGAMHVEEVLELLSTIEANIVDRESYYDYTRTPDNQARVWDPPEHGMVRYQD